MRRAYERVADASVVKIPGRPPRRGKIWSGAGSRKKGRRSRAGQAQTQTKNRKGPNNQQNADVAMTNIPPAKEIIIRLIRFTSPVA
jgi:hypothetical protein